MYKLRRLKTTGILALSVAMGGTMVACSNSEPASTDDTTEQTTEVATDESSEDAENKEENKEEAATGEVAATVNGEEITEDTVTEYVANFRESQGLQDDASWAAWMSENMYTPETVRQDVVDFYARDILLHQAADEYSVSATQEEIDESVDQIRSQFESDADFQEALSANGFADEQDYINTVIEPSIIENKLSEALASELESTEATDEEVVAMAQQYESLFNDARRSSHILFAIPQDATDEEVAAVEEKAQEVLDQINAGDITFEEAAAEYSEDSSATNGGDVGWDIFISAAGPTESFVTDYQDAVGDLDKDEVSELVRSDYGIHIIKCTDIYNVPEGGIESIDDIPEEFKEQIVSNIEYMAGDAFATWFDEYQQNAEIVINPMPEGLPYDIDMSAYETTAEEETGLLEDALVDDENAAVDDNTAANEEAKGEDQEADAANEAAAANEKDAAADEKAADDKANAADEAKADDKADAADEAKADEKADAADEAKADDKADAAADDEKAEDASSAAKN